MSIVLILQLAIVVFVILFFINWVVTLSGQTFRGCRWGDFILIFILGILIFSNSTRLRSLAGALPDTVYWLTSKPRAQWQKIQGGVNDTRQTVNALSDYLKDVAQRELEYQMKMETPR